MCDIFGGDLAGLIGKLDTVRDLGANTLYVTPSFKAASNHKYDTADYREIDPGFGSNADFVRLTKEAKKHGIRDITETSLNHTGSDSVYFNRYGLHGGGQSAFHNGHINPASPYALTLAETWFEVSKYFPGDMLDSAMNCIFSSAVLDSAAGGNAALLVASLEHLREACPPQALHAMMNLLS